VKRGIAGFLESIEALFGGARVQQAIDEEVEDALKVARELNEEARAVMKETRTTTEEKNGVATKTTHTHVRVTVVKK
jgi:hypothetical protein